MLEESMKKSIRGQQDELLEKLQTLDCRKPILVQTNIHGPWMERPVEGDTPYVTRGILRNEVVLDLDHPDAQIRDYELSKLQDYLNKLDWSYYVARTGGKGIHVHLFLDLSSVLISESTAQRMDQLKKTGKDVDISRLLRTYVGDRICLDAGLIIDHVDPEGNTEHWIDRQKYSFSSNNKGSQIRMVGCIRDNGRTKELLDRKGDSLPIPNKVPTLVNLKIWDGDIESCIEAHFEMLERQQVLPIQLSSLEGLDCVSKLKQKGAPEGIRNTLALPMAVLLKAAGLSEDQAIAIMDEYSEHCINADSENASSNRATLSGRFRKELGTDDVRISCSKIRKELGDGFCDCSECPVEAVESTEYQNCDDATSPRWDDHSQAIEHGLIEFNQNNTISVNHRTCAEYIVKHLNIKHIYWKDSDRSKILVVYDPIDGAHHIGAETTIRKSIGSLLHESTSIHHKNEIIDQIKDIALTSSNEVIDMNPFGDWVLVNNGRLNPSTGEFKEGFSPDDLYMNPLPVRYDPDATCPELEKFLAEVVGPEYVQTMLEIVGYGLFGGYPIQKVPLLTSPGRSGKGTFEHVLSAFYGSNNVSAVSLHALSGGDKFQGANLVNKRLNIAGELSAEGLKDTAGFKGLTGNDLLTVQRKGEHSFEYRNEAKMIFSTNNVPRTNDDSVGFFARFLPIEFLHNFEAERRMDSNILDRLTTESELSGLLNKSLKAGQELIKRGRFTNDMTAEEVRSWWQSKTDSVLGFLDESTGIVDIQTEDDFENHDEGTASRNRTMVPQTVLYEAYKKYCEEQRTNPVKESVFKKKLKEHVPDIQFGIKATPNDVSTNKLRVLTDTERPICYVGIGLSEEYRAKRYRKFKPRKSLVSGTGFKSLGLDGMSTDEINP